MRRGVQRYGYACVSPDYRLAPQVGIKDILDDVKDCIEFVRTKLSICLNDPTAIDASRLAISGSSAGGYLSLLAGPYVQPKPAVVAPIYPITDPYGAFFTTPQSPPLKRRPIAYEEVSTFLDRHGEVITSSGPIGEDPRSNLYTWMCMSANLATLLGLSDTDAASQYRVSRVISTRGLPPTYVLHGDHDTAVGVEQADEVVGACLGCGIEIKYERLRGLEHTFDDDEAYENNEFYAFIMKHLMAAPGTGASWEERL